MNETGGPAFPHVADLVRHSPNGGITTKQITSGGMTLRDYFAAKAMQGWVACSPVIMGEPMNGSVQMAEQLAGASFVLADAMLKARHADKN